MKKLLTLLFFSITIVKGQIPEPIPNTYVNDLSQSLNKEQIKQLNDSILSIEKRTSVQIAILILSELPANMEIEDYARELGKKWGVGNARNGIVYVASLKEHKQRLEVAQNLEGDIPDITALEITNNLKPFLRTQDYAGAINELLKEINNHVDPIAKEQLRLDAIEDEKRSDKIKDSILTGFLWLLGLSGAGFGIFYFFFLPKIRLRRKEMV